MELNIISVVAYPGNIERWQKSGEFENAISAIGQLYQRLHADILRYTESDAGGPEKYRDTFLKSVEYFVEHLGS